MPENLKLDSENEVNRQSIRYNNEVLMEFKLHLVEKAPYPGTWFYVTGKLYIEEESGAKFSKIMRTQSPDRFEEKANEIMEILVGRYHLDDGGAEVIDDESLDGKFRLAIRELKERVNGTN